jgi:hypothetical protein
MSKYQNTTLHFFLSMSIDYIFCVLSVLQKKIAYGEAGHFFLHTSSKSMKSVRREVLYNIHMYFLESGKANKMCVNESYRNVRMVKRLSDMFRTENGLKHGDALSPLLFNFV